MYLCKTGDFDKQVLEIKIKTNKLGIKSDQERPVFQEEGN